MRRLTLFLALAAALGFLSLSSGTEAAGPTAAAPGQPVCHIPAGSFRVDYTPDHPYRVGIIEVDEKCNVTTRIEELTAEEFGRLGVEPEGVIEQVSAVGGPKLRGQDPSAGGDISAAIIPGGSSRKVRGNQEACHDLIFTCVFEVRKCGGGMMALG